MIRLLLLAGAFFCAWASLMTVPCGPGMASTVALIMALCLSLLADLLDYPRRKP